MHNNKTVEEMIIEYDEKIMFTAYQIKNHMLKGDDINVFDIFFFRLNFYLDIVLN